MMHKFICRGYHINLGNGSDIQNMKGLLANVAQYKKLTKLQKKLWDRIKHVFQVLHSQNATASMLMGARHINDDGMYCYYYLLDGEKIEVVSDEHVDDIS